MFDDMSRPIKFDIEKNDWQFDGILNTGIVNEWAWDLADEYAHYFDDMDINTFVDYDHQSTITFNENMPLITDTIQGE